MLIHRGVMNRTLCTNRYRSIVLVFVHCVSMLANGAEHHTQRHFCTYFPKCSSNAPWVFRVTWKYSGLWADRCTVRVLSTGLRCRWVNRIHSQMPETPMDTHTHTFAHHCKYWVTRDYEAHFRLCKSEAANDRENIKEQYNSLHYRQSITTAYRVIQHC